MKIRNLLTVFIALFVIFLVACSITDSSTGQAVKQDNSPIKIGFIGPLSGEAASWGDSALAGAKLAVSDINANGGINGRQIELIVEDGKCSSNSVSAVNKLIGVDNVVGIVGPVCSSEAGPIVQLTQDYGKPMVLIGASAPHLTQNKNYVFRVYISDAFQGKLGAQYIYNDMEKKKAALVYVKNDWGQGIKKVFKQEFENLGGEVVYESGVLQTETDFKTIISKIQASGAEVLYFPVYPLNALSAFKQMDEMGFNLPIVTGDGLAGDEVILSGYGDGLMYTVARTPNIDDFIARVKSQQGFSDLNMFVMTPYGYDAVHVLSEAIEKSGTDGDSIRQSLGKTAYVGVSNSLIEFDEQGDLKKSEIELKVIKNKKSIFVKIFD